MIYVVENSDGDVQSVGYESRRDARDDQRECFPGGCVRAFEDAQALRAAYPGSRWLGRYSDAELEEVPA